MSDGKKQGEEKWRDATAEDAAEIIRTGKPKKARVKDCDDGDWQEDFIVGSELCSAGARWICTDGLGWTRCQVYVEPAPTRSPKDGCRMLEDNEEPMPGDFINWGAGWRELGEGSFPLSVPAPAWYCRPIEVPVESGPPSSIGLTYDPWTDTVSRVVRTDETGKVVESIGQNVGPEVIEAFSPVTVETKPELKQHRTPTLADLRGGAITCEVRQGSGDNWEKKLLIHIFPVYGFPFVTASQGSIHRWAYCRIEVPVGKSDRPVPKGFRMLGDEPRLASDGYWSLSCKDWLVIGDRVEEANRDKWPAIRLVVEEPEPVKQFVLANDQDNEQALYVNGKLEDIDHPIYGYNIAEAANGCTIRIESREVGRPDPDDEWPTKLSELIIVDKEQREDPSGEWEATKDEVEYAMDRCGVPASVFGSDPIKASPIMKIRLPVPASVLGKLGDMLEKHYPGSTMRQADGFLVFEEPIES